MKKFSKIFGIAAAVSMLASLMIVAAPASAADPLQWNSSATLSTSDTKNELLSGANVTDMAVAGDNSLIWAVSDGAVGGSANLTLVSTDGGKVWTRKDSGLAKPALVAIAPDDPQIVAIAGTLTAGGDINDVRISTNGGTTWSTLTGHSVDTIKALAISPASAGVHYVAIGGNTTGVAALEYFNLGASVPSWVSPITTVPGSWTDSTAGTSNISAIAFSPAFASDKIMTVVSDDGTDAYLEIASFASKLWNAALGFSDYDGTINKLGTTAGTVLAADIALFPTYLGADDNERKAFVGITGTGDSGLFRMNDATDTQIATSTITSVESIAYDGTNIVVGASASNVVWSSSNPTATSPTVAATTIYQRPGGQTQVKVAWLGSTVVAGTRGISSAFAVSDDMGVNFNDISLIDTALTTITDYQKSADGGTTFMVSTDSAARTSVWKKVSRWERILTSTTGFDIIRMPADGVNNLYLADLSSATMLYSSDGGETKWSQRTLPATPKDLAVESNEVAYIVNSSGDVYKTTNGGFIWGTAKNTGLSSGATIVSLGTDLVLVGGNDDGVAWSTDGNASATTWTAKTSTTGNGGPMQVAASGLADGDFIYAAGNEAGSNVARWKIGTSTSWDDIIANTTGNFTGLVLSEGVLYAISVDTVAPTTTLYRTLSPTTAKSTTTWDSVTEAKLANVLPRSLVVTTGSASQNLYVINTAGTDGIRTFEDTLYSSTLVMNAPADAAIIPVNPVSGRAYEVVLSWTRPSLATSYTLQIAYDSAFTELATSSLTVASTSSTVVQTVGPYTTGLELNPGRVFYWRVKAAAPIAGPYSAVRSFSIEDLQAAPAPFVVDSPAPGASSVSIMPLLTWGEYPGAIRYEVALSEDPSFAIVEWVRNVDNNFYSVEEALKYSTTYYWRVRGVTGERVGTGPVPAGPWATGVFQTMDEPAAPTTTPAQPTATVIVTQPGTTTVVEVPTTTPAPIPAYLLWLVIIIGAILIIALIVLIVRTRRVA